VLTVLLARLASHVVIAKAKPEAIQKWLIIMNYTLHGMILCNVIAKANHLQNLVFCEKARSASIFVAVCVSAR
jgi:hypothetical protein